MEKFVEQPLDPRLADELQAGIFVEALDDISLGENDETLRGRYGNEYDTFVKPLLEDQNFIKQVNDLRRQRDARIMSMTDDVLWRTYRDAYNRLVLFTRGIRVPEEVEEAFVIELRQLRAVRGLFARLEGISQSKRVK